MDIPKDLEKELLSDYEAAYERIIGKLTTSRGDLSYSAYAKQSQLLKQIGKIIDQFKGTAAGYFDKAIKAIAEYRIKAAIADIEDDLPENIKPEQWHPFYNEDKVKYVYEDAYEHIASRTDNMKQSVKKMLRDESSLIFRRAAMEGITPRKAHKLLMDQILTNNPDFKFIDRAGKHWDNEAYFRMLTRTVMSQSANDFYCDTLAQKGHDLVQVSRHGASDPCRFWEGKILSLTGKTKGYKTVAEAKATNEIFHPRCKHTLLYYNKEIEGIFNDAN